MFIAACETQMPPMASRTYAVGPAHLAANADIAGMPPATKDVALFQGVLYWHM